MMPVTAMEAVGTRLGAGRGGNAADSQSGGGGDESKLAHDILSRSLIDHVPIT
jgi:hypothetical protein